MCWRLLLQEEQAKKRARALSNLQQFVQSCGESCRHYLKHREPPIKTAAAEEQYVSLGAGGALPEGWDCSMRFRMTSRRHGRRGLTTDNYYYSPCGQTFRTHKQVAEFLGLQQPVKPKQQQQEQPCPSAEECTEAHYSTVSITILDTASDFFFSTASHSSRQSAKREHSTMTNTDTASQLQTSADQQHPAAVSAPAAVTTAHAASSMCVTQHSHEPSVSAPPAGQAYPSKRTKAALAAKYSSSSSGIVSAAVTAAAAGAPSSSTCGVSQSSNSCQTEPFSQVRTSPTAASTAEAIITQQPAALPLKLVTPAEPAASTNISAKRSTGRGMEAVTSRPPAKPACPPQQQRAAVQPVPKWKPRKVPAWRAKMRELATQAVMESRMQLPGSGGSTAGKSASA